MGGPRPPWPLPPVLTPMLFGRCFVGYLSLVGKCWSAIEYLCCVLWNSSYRLHRVVSCTITNSPAIIINDKSALFPAPTLLIGTTETVKLLSSGSGWSMEYSSVVSSTNIISFSPLMVLVMVTL